MWQDDFYATGVDSRVIHCKLTEDMQVQLTSKFRGQSHDIKAMILLGKGRLITAGETTDLCIYSLEANGAFREQYGKKSKIEAR